MMQNPHITLKSPESSWFSISNTLAYIPLFLADFINDLETSIPRNDFDFQTDINFKLSFPSPQTKSTTSRFLYVFERFFIRIIQFSLRYMQKYLYQNYTINFQYICS